MAVIALDVADKVSVVESILQITLPAAEAIEAGAAVRLDTTNGKITNANGTTTAEARFLGIALKSVAAGEAVTVLRRGVIEGFNLSSLAYDAPVYLSNTDGAIDTAAGTVSVVVGRVIPAHGQVLETALDKLLSIE